MLHISLLRHELGRGKNGSKKQKSRANIFDSIGLAIREWAGFFFLHFQQPEHGICSCGGFKGVQR